MFEDRPFILTVMASFLSLYGFGGLICFLQRAGVATFFNMTTDFGKALIKIYPLLGIIDNSRGASLMIMLLLGSAGLLSMRRWSIFFLLPTLSFLIYLHSSIPIYETKVLMFVFAATLSIIFLFYKEIR
jgi:hypothetical protein